MGYLARIGQAAAAALALGLLPAAAAAGTAGGRQAPAAPVLNWSPCPAAGFECATAAVPLDYRDPAGQTISIAVIRHPATDPAQRIGTLFFNPGGPGDPGVQFLPLLYRLFPPQVRARFDIVSFDPRGVGASTAVQCYPSLAAEQQALAGLAPGFPVTRAQELSTERINADFGRACGDRAGALLSHVSTANVARDMDLLRQAVGDRQLSYLGISYGSYLGATYANLFPGKVRALVLDGDVDPVANATGYGDQARRLDSTLRIGQDEGMAATVAAFLRLCGQAPAGACAFSAGTPAATTAKYQALLQRLRQQPVTIGSTEFTYAVAVGFTAVLTYTTQPSPAGTPGWAGLATLLQELWAASGPGPARTAPPAIAPGHGLPSGPLPAPLPPLPPGPGPAAPAATSSYTGPEQGLAPVCADSPNPRDPASYPLQAAFAYARSGPFGPFRAWAVEACATWPLTAAQDRYTGPWDRPTAHPVLLIGTTTDPGTAYAGSLAMARELSRARLLTVAGYGHTSLLNPSACASGYESAYLIGGSLPPPGTVCQQDQPPFPG